ncbi:MAG TPA: hypothetical protein VK250_01640 [Nitrososphaeraceae archaeon]|nr:hypothetical protein [Nitrososphaeraceae archaeon]
MNWKYSYSGIRFMASIARWNEDGPIAEEHLFWDNAEFMKQIGLDK